ncbi:hypothetical protein LTR05_002282 [Lithohypha guttulata]|uniref:Hydantoinase n=1 Tax=Lithohypha guttulata TaxID=1690604 RepID=A0AAN7YHW3_9EURO|nr:hypothetical protein LTR05_002282 [Lithohypha guttulata]
MYRIGCDVGGTNTDAVLLDISRLSSSSKGVLATHKTTTTPNVTDGIRTAIEKVLVKSGVDRDEVINVAIGTTHFVNAVVEGDARRLDRVACVRLCGPYTRSIPPFSDYPYALREIVEGPCFHLDGGLEVDGREIKPLSPDQVRETADAIYSAGIRAVAIVGVFSALDHEGIHEERCRQLMLKSYPDLLIVTSNTIGGPGLLVRENATILNAAILRFAGRTIRGFRRAMHELALTCPLFLTQNDGTLIEASAAAKLPIKTFASGPTNSLMGAAFLQGHGTLQDLRDKQVLVVDIGGTTTDICALLPSGFPRKAASSVEIGGVRTAFSMPEVYSIGLGGGTRVRADDRGEVTIGPDSVGHNLVQDALVFGGETLTTSDIMVAAGVARIGDAEKVTALSRELVAAAVAGIKRTLEKAIDKMKVSASPAFVLLVGGGSVVFPPDMIMEHIKPIHHDSANAVGAAIAKIAGEIDVVEILAGRDEDQILEDAKQKAIAAAVARGASEKDVTIAELSKIPLQYVNNKATRLLVKAVGCLKTRPDSSQIVDSQSIDLDIMETDTSSAEAKPGSPRKLETASMAQPSLEIDLSSYRPKVHSGVWYVSAIDVEFCALGCGILGTGGGGSSHNVMLYVLDIIRTQGEGAIRVMSPDALNDDDICVFGSGYGAPSVSDERLQSGEEIPATVDELNKLLGHKSFQGIVAVEIGGGNGIVTFPTSARFSVPVIDCDLMGRAYPTAEHCTPYVYGHPVMPVAMADAKGNVSIVVRAENNTKLEGMLRTTCVELGNAVGVTGKPLDGRVIKEFAIPNTLSQAWFLGRAVHLARRNKIDFIEAIGDVTPVKLLYTGKIVDVSRDVSRGYTVGKCTIAPVLTDELRGGVRHETTKGSRNLIITFQNEYLIAYLEEAEPEQKREVLCVVPDLISILGSNGEALGSPDLRYGLQVKVIGMPAHPLWTATEQALRIGGPEFFKLDVPWRPLGEYQKPKSVIDVYNETT